MKTLLSFFVYIFETLINTVPPASDIYWQNFMAKMLEFNNFPCQINIWLRGTGDGLLSKHFHVVWEQRTRNESQRPHKKWRK